MKMSKSFKRLSVLMIAALFVIAGCGNNNAGSNNASSNNAFTAAMLQGELRIPKPLPRLRNAASCW